MISLLKSLSSTIISISIALFILLISTISFHAYNLNNINETQKDWKSTFEGYSPERKKSYSHMKAEDVANLLYYTWDNKVAGWEYEPVLGFKEIPRTSKFVNVTEDGIRKNNNDDLTLKDLQGSIWVFGGSTTFGYGVTDKETIPAFLDQQMPNTKAINLGRGYYFSRQENDYLSYLLSTGLTPERVIFIDGINERCNIGIYQAQMGRLFNRAQKSYSWNYLETFKPIIYGLKYNRETFDTGEVNKAMSIDTCAFSNLTQPLSSVLIATLKERQAICNAFDINCITFLQPFAGIHGIHLDDNSLSKEAQKTLETKFNKIKPAFIENGAISLENALDSIDGHAYADNVHYNAKANKAISNAIYQHILSAHRQQ